MNNVIQFDEYKPYASGPCKCGYCGHEWIGVMPIPLDKDRGYECEKCGRMFGFLVYPVAGRIEDEMYVCNTCEGSFFSVHRGSIVCGICGTRHLNVLEKCNADKS